MNEDKSRKAEKQHRDEAKDATSTATTTIERTESSQTSEAQEAGGDGTLSPLEEKVVRMRYGKSLKGQEALDFAPGASLETRLKLALIEASLLEAFEADALEPDPITGSPRSVLADSID